MAVQESECRQLADRNGWNIVDVYTDNDVSAFSGRTRPAYETMLRTIQQGGIDGILVWHIDRLYRRTADLEQIVSLVEQTGVRVDTVKSGELELNTATGRMTARIVASMSQYEVDHQIERQLASHSARAAKGQFRGGTPPYGYTTGEKKGTLVVVPEDAERVRTAVDIVLSGRSILSVCKRFNTEGVPAPRGSATWRANTVKRIITNPAIAGLVRHNGKIVGEAQWEPIIDKQRWQAVCDLTNDPARLTHASSVRKWQGTGLYLCGRCGAKMGTGKSKSNAGLGRVYACKHCHRISRKIEDVDGVVDAVVLGYLDKPENRLSILRSDQGAEESAQALLDERTALIARKDRLGALYAAGEIDDAQLVQGTEGTRKRVEVLDRRVRALRGSVPLTDLVLAGDRLREHWEGLSAEARGEVIRALMVVTILPAQRGAFRPESVDIAWR